MIQRKIGNVAKLTVCVLSATIFCDWFLFPMLFSNIVHSRYFSLQCNNSSDSSCIEVNKIFWSRNINCKVKANEYWMNQKKKIIRKNVMYGELNHYWSNEMIDFLHYNKQNTLDLLVMIVSVRRKHES